MGKKKKKKKEESEPKNEPKLLSVDEFAGSNEINSRREYFLDKKYGDKKRSAKEWEKICKEENISV